MSGDLLGFESEDGITSAGGIPVSEKGAPNGVATLDGAGTVPLAQIPASIKDSLNVVGTWNAATNTPTFADGVGVTGDMYKVSVSGTTSLDGINVWDVGDIAFFSDVLGAWCKLDNTDPEAATVAPVNVAKSPAAVGVSLKYAREDHAHSIATTAPVDIGTANAEGAGTNLARAFHVHNHGQQTVETHHAVTSASAAGFFPRSNLTATDDPDQADDTTQGFQSGSMFVNESWVGGAVFTCTDPATAAAEWQLNAKPQIPGVSTDGLVFAMQAGDVNSYPGSGLSVRNIAAGIQTAQLGVLSGDVVFADGGFLFDSVSGMITFDVESELDDFFSGASTVSSWSNALSAASSGRILSKASAANGWFARQTGAGGVGAFPDVDFQVRRATTNALFRVAKAGEFVVYGTPALISWSYDSDNPDTPPRCRINGIERTVTVVIAGAGAYVSDAGEDLIHGNRFAGDNTLDGTVFASYFHNRVLTDAEAEIMFSAGAPLVGLEVGGGGGADMFTSSNANDAIFPGSNPAGTSVRNGHPVLTYDATTAESVSFSLALSRDYNGKSVTVDIDWVAATATTGDVVWGVEIERLNAGGTDIDSDSFDTQQTGTSTTNGTSGIITRTSIILTNAEADAWAAGDSFRIRLQRVAADGGDTMTGDAEVLRIAGRQ